MAYQRADEVKVGIMVVVSSLLLFVTIIMVGSYSPFRTRPSLYKARFSYVGGLSQGSTVRLGGLTVGRVESIKVTEGNSSSIAVELSVKPGTPIKRDSEAAITSLGLLGDNYIEITLGSPGAELLPPGEYLKNSQYPSLPEIFKKVDAAVADAQTLIKSVNSQLDRIAGKADTLLTDVDKVFDDANRQKLSSILNETDKTIKEASPKVDTTLANIQKASERLDPIMDKADTAIKKVNQVVDNVDATISETRPELRKTMQDLDKALEDARGTIADMRSMLNYNRSQLDLLIENMAASSDNLREFTDTVKQYPFSLLRTPPYQPRKLPEIQK
jgi:phospholipid/cholesterol/gamma-HCH transport system substrate-binding protein